MPSNVQELHSSTSVRMEGGDGAPFTRTWRVSFAIYMKWVDNGHGLGIICRNQARDTEHSEQCATFAIVNPRNVQCFP